MSCLLGVAFSGEVRVLRHRPKVAKRDHSTTDWALPAASCRVPGGQLYATGSPHGITQQVENAGPRKPLPMAFRKERPKGNHAKHESQT